MNSEQDADDDWSGDEVAIAIADAWAASASAHEGTLDVPARRIITAGVLLIAIGLTKASCDRDHVIRSLPKTIRDALKKIE